MNIFTLKSSWGTASFKDRFQIFLLMVNKLKRINWLLFPLKSPELQRKGNKEQEIPWKQRFQVLMSIAYIRK